MTTAAFGPPMRRCVLIARCVCPPLALPVPEEALLAANLYNDNPGFGQTLTTTGFANTTGGFGDTQQLL